MPNTYAELIENFLHQQVPVTASTKAQFEAVVAAVFGTKQRRFGPMPDPETQVAIREIIGYGADIVPHSYNHIHFFMPWGSRKQTNGAPLDTMEFMALQQLYSLQQELALLGTSSHFSFRLEDLTDAWLFGTDVGAAAATASRRQSVEYIANFRALASMILKGPNVSTVTESQLVSEDDFIAFAAKVAPVFYKYLRGDAMLDSLREIGWQGAMPKEQLDYYRNSVYGAYWPNGERDPDWELAKYFASTLARVKLGATALPGERHVAIAFNHPVPGSPFAGNRIYYRSIPQRFTNTHRAPWNSRGYFEISEDNTVTPKSAGPNETTDGLVETTIGLECGATIRADYVLR